MHLLVLITGNVFWKEIGEVYTPFMDLAAVPICKYCTSSSIVVPMYYISDVNVCLVESFLIITSESTSRNCYHVVPPSR